MSGAPILGFGLADPASKGRGRPSFAEFGWAVFGVGFSPLNLEGIASVSLPFRGALPLGQGLRSGFFRSKLAAFALALAALSPQLEN